MATDEILQTIARAIRSLQFGTLEIVVHDSKVVRIERRERIRLETEKPNHPIDHPTATRRTTAIEQP